MIKGHLYHLFLNIHNQSQPFSKKTWKNHGKTCQTWRFPGPSPPPDSQPAVQRPSNGLQRVDLVVPLSFRRGREHPRVPAMGFTRVTRIVHYMT